MDIELEIARLAMGLASLLGVAYLLIGWRGRRQDVAEWISAERAERRETAAVLIARIEKIEDRLAQHEFKFSQAVTKGRP